MKKLWLCTLVVLASVCLSAQTVTTLSKPYSRSLDAATDTGDGAIFFATPEAGVSPVTWTMSTAITGFSGVSIQLQGSINKNTWQVITASTNTTGESLSASGVVAHFVKCVLVSKTGTGTATCDVSASSAQALASKANLSGDNHFLGNQQVDGTLVVGTTNPVTAAGSVQLAVSGAPAMLSAPFAGFMRALAGGQSAALQVISDSTGVGTARWPYLTTQWLAAQYPAYNVNFLAWNDTTQAFDAPTVIQAGPSGPRYINCVGNANGLTMPYTDVSTLSGDIDVRLKIAPNSWRPAAAINLLKRWQAGQSNNQFYFKLHTDGQLMMDWSPDGSETDIWTASGSAVTDFGANTAAWVRFTFEVASHAVKFYSSPDGTTWTQVGSTVTTSAGSPYSGWTGTLGNWIDAWLTGGSLTGNLYRVEIRNGVNGPIVSPQNIGAWASLGTCTMQGSPDLTVINSSKAGADIAYFLDTTRQPKIMPNWTQTAVIVSMSHNEGKSTGATEMNRYGLLFSSIAKAMPTAHLVVLTQNPRTAPATYNEAHAIRRQQLMSWTQSPIGYEVIDTYAAFLNSPLGLAALIDNTDGIHPIAAGNSLWVSVMESAMAAAASPITNPVSSSASGFTGSCAPTSTLTVKNGLISGCL